MSANSTAILFRFDASSSIGYGHATRCFALSEAFRARGYSTHFHVSEETSGLLQKFGVSEAQIHLRSSERASADDARATARLALDLGARWIVLDGYDFLNDYIDTLRSVAPLRVLTLDDGVNNDLRADIILNQNLGAEHTSHYQALPTTRLLLGSQYILFRKQFYDAQPKPLNSTVHAITLTFGGGDTRNIAEMMLRIFSGAGLLNDLSVRLIVGGTYCNRSRLDSIPIPSTCTLEIIDFTPDILGLYRSSDVVISAAGSTAWELALLRIPMALVTVADNQMVVAQALDERGAALYLGDIRSLDTARVVQHAHQLLTNPSTRRQLHERCAEVCDCYGASRVVDAVEAFA